jgi:hypothetical protein
MNQNEFNHIVKSVPALSPEQMELLRRELDNNLSPTATSSTSQDSDADEPARVPAWKRIIESMNAVPDEVFDRIPTDSSEQLDHYLYGTPRRPTV